MKKTEEYVSELVTCYKETPNEFNNKVSDVLVKDLLLGEFKDLREARNLKFDNGLIPILKELRKKWLNVCMKFNKEVDSNILQLAYFDRAYKACFASTYDWYIENVL